LAQHGAAALVRRIEIESTTSAGFGLATVLNVPNVFGTVSFSVNTGDELRLPTMAYGIGVVLA
jgi:hypothetical protein